MWKCKFGLPPPGLFIKSSQTGRQHCSCTFYKIKSNCCSFSWNKFKLCAEAVLLQFLFNSKLFTAQNLLPCNWSSGRKIRIVFVLKNDDHDKFWSCNYQYLIDFIIKASLACFYFWDLQNQMNKRRMKTLKILKSVCYWVSDNCKSRDAWLLFLFLHKLLISLLE